MINAHYDMPSDIAAEMIMQKQATKAILYGRPSGNVLTLKLEDGAIDAYIREFETTHDEAKAKKAYSDYFKNHQP